MKVFKRSVVYFIQGKLTQRIKIGSTQCLIDERMKELQTGSPDELNFIGAYFGSQYSETQVHDLFSKSRLHGEWFEPTDDIFKFIANDCVTDLKSSYFTYQQIEDGSLPLEQVVNLEPKELARRYDVYLSKLVSSISF